MKLGPCLPLTLQILSKIIQELWKKFLQLTDNIKKKISPKYYCSNRSPLIPSPNLYVPSTINIWKKVLTKTIWADKNRGKNGYSNSLKDWFGTPKISTFWTVLYKTEPSESVRRRHLAGKARHIRVGKSGALF